MLIELDVFSGRPNPRWELDERTTRELQRLLRRLKRSTATPAEPPWMDGPEIVRVYRGYLRTRRAVYADASMTVEKFLVDHLPKEFEQLRGRIARELT